MSIYDDEAGRQEVRAWCTAQLDGAPVVRRRETIYTGLGPTHITVAGEAGPWVVVLPAATECAAVLGRLTAELARDHRVAVVDLPGEPGLSHDTPPLDNLVGRYGSWVDQVVSVVTGGTAVLVADGLGATVGLCATTERVAGLVAVSPAGINDQPIDLGHALKELRLGLAPTQANADRLLRPLYGDSVPDEHGLLVEWAVLVARTSWPSEPPALLPAAVLARWRDVPHQVLLGEHEPMHQHGSISRPVHALMNSRVQAVPGVGAALVHEAPDVVATVTRSLTAGPVLTPG